MVSAGKGDNEGEATAKGKQWMVLKTVDIGD